MRAQYSHPDIIKETSFFKCRAAMEFSSLFSLFLERYEYFGIFAGLVMLAALIVPIPFYIGREGERYSCLNHFASELGEAGVSKAAWVFNTGLIIGGGLFLPFCIGLGLSIGNLAAALGMAAGIWTSVSCTLIGVFSMDKIEAHIRAALSFFDGGLATVLLFTIGIGVQPVGKEIIPREAAILGILLILINIAFMITNPRPKPGAKLSDFLRPDAFAQRPGIWRAAILEWLVILSTVFWYLSTALILASG